MLLDANIRKDFMTAVITWLIGQFSAKTEDDERMEKNPFYPAYLLQPFQFDMEKYSLHAHLTCASCSMIAVAYDICTLGLD